MSYGRSQSSLEQKKRHTVTLSRVSKHIGNFGQQTYNDIIETMTEAL